MGLKENLRDLETLRRVLGIAEAPASFGAEVRLARTKRGLTLEALSNLTGMAKSYLSQIETGYAPPPRGDKIRKIAAALGLDEETLMARAHLSQMPDEVKQRMARLREVFDSTEEVLRALLANQAKAKAEEAAAVPPRAQESGPTSAPAAPGAAPGAPGAETPAPGPDGRPPAGVSLDGLHRSGLLHHLAEWGADRVEVTGRRLRPIPVINKVAAGYPQEFTDLGYPVGVADEYVSVPADEVPDPGAFAVRVVGDSMEPRYREGDIVIFSPASQVDSGDDCFVRFAMTGTPSDGETTFKRVFFDAQDRVRLQPINERYAPTFVQPSQIEGIFRAVARYERL